MMADHGGFLSRWARRKEQAKLGAVAQPVVVETPQPGTRAAAPAQMQALAAVERPVAASEAAPESAAAVEPLPTLADVALLTRESDYSRFVTPGIDEGVKQAAMKKLFTDPHFNVMDGLDIYIDDYGKPDPIPLAVLRQMNQSKVLRLFEHEDEEAAQAAPMAIDPPTAAPHTEPLALPDDDADLRLQQDHAAGRPGPDQGAGA